MAIQFFYEFIQDGKLLDLTGSPEGTFDDTFIFPVERTATINTGFAWAPFLSFGQTFLVIVTLFDSNGTQVDQQFITFTGHLARFFNEIFSVQGDFLGYVLLESEDDICLTVLRQELTNGGFQLTSVPPDDLIF